MIFDEKVMADGFKKDPNRKAGSRPVYTRKKYIGDSDGALLLGNTSKVAVYG